MKLKINGKEEIIDQNVITLKELLAAKGLDASRVVIEHNMDIIPLDQLAGKRLEEGDTIELISFVGGG